MIKIKGKGVSAWFKTKLWFSLNAETLIDATMLVIMIVLGYIFVVGLMAITIN